MKERPILFSAPMIRAILEGRKTQTRRILKCDSHIDRIGTPHEWNRGRADDRMKRWEDWGPRTGHVLLHSGVSVFALRCPYGQPGDRLLCYHCAHEHYSGFKADSDLTERRLSSGVGRQNLQPDTLRGVRAEGARGLVSAGGAQRQAEGIHASVALPREQQGNDVGAPAGVHGISRVAADAESRDAAHGRKSGKQPADQSLLGNCGRELARQETPRNRDGWRAPPCCEIHGHGAGAYSLGNPTWTLQPEGGGTCAGCGAVVDSRHRIGGTILWVREAVWLPPPVTQHDLREGADTWPKCIYSADTDDTEIAWMRDMQWKQRPSIHMPRWASRILLEITDVRVQRVQDISDDDCESEGIQQQWTCINPGTGSYAHGNDVRDDFRKLWNSINERRGFGWHSNPWVWCLTFKRVDEAKG